MPGSPDTCNQLLEEFRAYLETLTFIQVDPRLRSKFGLSDIIQNTLREAWRDLERLEARDAESRKRWLRKMLVNNLLEEIAHWRTQGRDVRREQSRDAAADESSSRLQRWLAAEDTSPEHLGYTVNAVAGLHAHGLKMLRKYLTDLGVHHA
jgi:hypothetical protein